MNHSGLKSRLETVLKKFPNHISGIYFRIDDGEEVEHNGKDDPFALLIYVLYSTAIDPIAAQKEASDVSENRLPDVSSG